MRRLLVVVLALGCSSSPASKGGTGGAGGRGGTAGGQTGGASGGTAGSSPGGSSGGATGGSSGGAVGGSSGGAAGGSSGGATGGSSGGATGGSSGGATAGAGGASGGGAGGASPTRLDVSLDRSTVNTELGTTNTIAVTLTASGGFAGHVVLAATVLGAANAALTGWTIAIDTPGVDVVANGTALAHATITIPTQNAGLAATATITATSNATTGTSSATAAVTVLNQYTISMQVVANLCVLPPPGSVTLTIGSKMRWLNSGTDGSFIIHADDGGTGCAHQPTVIGTQPGEAYECTMTGSGYTVWYCHSPGPANANDHVLYSVLP